MSILGINNRTENWKTAYEFAPFFRDGNACAKLARTLEEGESPTGNEVKIELFWKGMRDYRAKTGRGKEDLTKTCAEAYNDQKLFFKLRSDVEKFIKQGHDNSPQALNPKNYRVTSGDEKELFNNLYNTEIDIVLETPGHLFIGEAKDESVLRGTGTLVLVHQLIREYVMAKILLRVMGSEKEVVPFMAVADADSTRKSGQVQFMISQKWLKKGNVLTWGDIRSLQP